MTRQTCGNKRVVIFFAIIFGFFLSFSAYLLFFQSPTLARRELGITIILWIAISPLIYYLLNGFFLSRIQMIGRRGIVLLLIASFLFGGFIVFSTNLPSFYLAFPDHSIAITVPPATGENADDRTVSVIWISHDLGDIGFSQLQQTGDWQISDTKITHTGPEAASLHWLGRMGSELQD